MTSLTRFKELEIALIGGAERSVSRGLAPSLQEIWNKIMRGETHILVDSFPGTDQDIGEHMRQGEIALFFPPSLAPATTTSFLVKQLGLDDSDSQISSKVSNTSDHFGWRWVYVGERSKTPYGRVPYTGLSQEETKLALQNDGRNGLTLNDALIINGLLRGLRGDFWDTVWYTRITESTLNGEPFSLRFERNGKLEVFQTGDLKGDWLGTRYSVPIVPQAVLTSKLGLRRIK